ncbi:MAG: DUF6049 family protein [Acidimicrobiales bacterium]
MSRRRRPGAGPARLLALVVGVSGLVGAAGPGALAGVQAPQLAPAGRISLASQSPWVPPGGTFDLRLDVAEVRRPENLEVAVTVRQAIRSRSQFQRTLEGRLLGDAVFETTTPLTTLVFDPGGAVSMSLPLYRPDAPPEPASLPRLGPGVYPVEVGLRLRQGPRVDGFVTHLVRLPDDGEATRLAVAWAQPLASPPALGPDGRVVLAERERADLGTIGSALAGTDLPLTVVPGPETLDALAAAGPGILATVAGALEGRQVTAGPYVDVDLDSLVAAGLGADIALQRRRGIETVATLLGVPPDPTTLSTDGDLDHATLGRLRALGVRRLILPEPELAPLDRRLTLTGPFALESPAGRVEALAVDEGLTAHFRNGDDPVLAAHQLLADLAVLFYDAPGRSTRGVVVRPPPGWQPSATFLNVVLPALAASPLLDPMTADQLFERVVVEEERGDPLVRRLTDGSRSDPGISRRQLDEARASLRSFATMVDPELAQLDLLERLLLVAEAGTLDSGRRRSYLDGLGALVGQWLANVEVVAKGSYRLTAREGTIPLTLVNRNPFPVTILLTLQSDKLELLDGQPTSTGRQALRRTLHQENTALTVRVRARTSGAFPLRITASSPDGNLQVGTGRLTVRSIAASGVGIVLSVGALAFLLWWWARHRRTLRRDRRLVARTSP